MEDKYIYSDKKLEQAITELKAAAFSATSLVNAGVSKLKNEVQARIEQGQDVDANQNDLVVIGQCYTLLEEFTNSISVSEQILQQYDTIYSGNKVNTVVNEVSNEEVKVEAAPVVEVPTEEVKVEAEPSVQPLEKPSAKALTTGKNTQFVKLMASKEDAKKKLALVESIADPTLTANSVTIELPKPEEVKEEANNDFTSMMNEFMELSKQENKGGVAETIDKELNDNKQLVKAVANS